MSRRGENIFKRKDGRWKGRYISSYTANGKAKYLSVYSRTYAECSQKLQLAKVDLLPKNAPITVGELFAVWLANRKSCIKPSSYVNYLTMYQTYISDRLGDIRVDKLSSFMISCHITDLLKCGRVNGMGLSSKSVQAILIMMKSVFKYGETEYNLKDPAKNIPLPKSAHREIEVFTITEMLKIRSNALCDNCLHLGILLSLYTGLRIGEICALKWKDIDIAEQVIHVRKTIQRIKNPDPTPPKTVVIIDDPKSSRSIRDIPIPTFMLSMLADIKLNMCAENYFLTCSLKHTEPRTYLYSYKKFLEHIGVEYRNFHVLRHTFATECIKRGIDVKTVSELLGHASVKTTLERYVHSNMDMKRKQLEKLYECV